MKLLRIITWIFIINTVYGLVNEQPNGLPLSRIDKEYQELLIGRWITDDEHQESGFFTNYIEYFPDGKLLSKM